MFETLKYSITASPNLACFALITVSIFKEIRSPTDKLISVSQHCALIITIITNDA